MSKGTLIKDFRKKVLEKRKDISDQDILLSAHCHAYFENLVEAITKQYDQTIKLRIVWNNDDWIAFATDRYEVVINVNNKFVLGAEKRVDKVVYAKGISIHECGHLLFTDYHLLKSVRTVFEEKRKLFPEPKCMNYTEWLTDAAAMSDVELKQWMRIWKRLENSIEDGFIEYKLLELLPGEGQCLYALRKQQLSDFDSVKVMKSQGLSSPVILFNCILMLAKYNTVLMDADDADDPAVTALLDNYDLIRQAVYTEKSYDRVKLINEIFCNLYHFMKEDAKKNDDADKQGDSSDDSSGSQNTDDQSESGDSDNTEDDNSSGSQGNQNEDSGESETGDASDEDEDPSGDDQHNESDGSNGTDTADNGSNGQESAQGTQGSKSCSPTDLLENSPEEMNEQVDTGSGSVLNDNNINQKPIPPARNKEEKLNNIINGTEQEETAEIPSPQDKRLVDEAENNIAEQAVKENAEKELSVELQKELQEFKFTAINSNFPISIIRKDPSEESYVLYAIAMEEIGFLVKKTVNELKNKIKDQQQGGKLNGMYNGRYLDRNNLHRYDMRIMCKNDLPEDIPDMAISILMDGSFSMMDDKKYWYAIMTTLLLYLVCQELNIPVMVYSHNASYNSAEITALADFNSVDGRDKYRICDMTPDNGNRDGMALRFCSEKLAKRPEQNKFQIIISDGLPSAYETMEEGRTDIRNVLTDYAKRNVKYIAYGLGEDQQRIEEIYVQDLSPKTAAKFIKTNAPSELPKMFVKAIKDLIKV